MKTTVDIPDHIMEETALYSGAKTKRDAILSAMQEYNHRHRAQQVIALFGTAPSMMTNDEIEALETERLK